MATETDHKLELLARGVGTWEGVEKMPPSDRAPEGITAVGRNIARMTAGDAILVNDYTQTINGEVTMRGHAVTVWNDAKRRCFMYYFDSAGNPPAVFEGDFHDGALALVGDTPEGQIRHTTDHPDADTMRTVSDILVGDSWQRVFESTYKRT